MKEMQQFKDIITSQDEQVREEITVPLVVGQPELHTSHLTVLLLDSLFSGLPSVQLHTVGSLKLDSGEGLGTRLLIILASVAFA